MAANTLQQMYEHGQSPWIDNITRGMLQTGELQRLIDQGIVGLPSNPTIFQKAIGAGNDYDDALRSLVRAGKSVDDIYDGLVLEDIKNALGTLRQVYDRTKGGDLRVSSPPNFSICTCEKTMSLDARAISCGSRVAPSIYSQ